MISTLITTNTESGDATSSFTSSIDATYDHYMFVFTDIAPANNSVEFQFNGSIDGGSNYNVAKTTTYFSVHHQEDDGDLGLNYRTADDLAQGTGFQIITTAIGSGSDESAAGVLHLFSPSSTTYLKHFWSRFSTYRSTDELWDTFIAGYFEDADDNIDAIQFKMGSGNFDGVIQMYGIA